MSRYTATIKHNSIARARIVNVGETLRAAKINATREFGSGYLDHMIVIYDSQIPEHMGQIVATKRVDAPKWTNVPRL